jgi:hypothetical protein
MEKLTSALIEQIDINSLSIDDNDMKRLYYEDCLINEKLLDLEHYSF